MLRHLIRTSTSPNDPKVAAQVTFLLSIPCIQDLLHRPISGAGEQNELLRLALIQNKADWVSRLMSFEAVATQAAQDNYYAGEALGTTVDLRALAQDHESSLRALNHAEREIIDTLGQFYPVRDVKAQWSQMVDEIKFNYQEKPAQLTLVREKKEVSIDLPLLKDDFEALCQAQELSVTERQKANEAYFKHAIHTTFRFLMTPNPWMSERASHVLVGENRGYTAYWLGYESLLIQLWRAASDKNAPLTDDYILKGRIGEYFNSIALVARAHNWDSTRAVVRMGKTFQEQFDDLEGDKPSCFSGMHKRFVSAVKGHATSRECRRLCGRIHSGKNLSLDD